jgi:hypothetical protein
MFASKPTALISYSRKDRETVDGLARRLSSRGIRTWMDTKQIIGGYWQTEIKRGLRHSNFFIACLSRNTAQPGDVLRFEYASALEIQQERLEGDIFIVPVRLEPCEIPEAFSKFQTIDLYDQAGWDNLLRALRSKSAPSRMPLLALALTVVLAAVGAYIWLQPTAQAELFAARTAGKNAAVRNSVQVGVTLWKMQSSSDSDPPSVREIVHPHRPGHTETGTEQWTPVRIPDGSRFHKGEYFEVGIESSRKGFLYVFNRSYRNDGSLGPASMIFPTNRIRSGENQVWPGELLRLPDRNSDPPYFEFASERSDYAGELLMVLLSPDPIQDLPTGQDSLPVADEALSFWSTNAGKDVRLRNFDTPQLRLTTEEAASRDGLAPLTRAAPLPEFLFEAKRNANAAFFCTLKIPVVANE